MSQDGNNVSRRRFLTAAGTAAATAALAGCSGGGGEETTTESGEGTTEGETDQTEQTEQTEDDGSNSVLRYGRGSHSPTLDFQNSTSGEVAKVTEQLYDTLINFEPGQSTLTQGLATEYSLEGETASITLREGVMFHNGEEFTAEDFVATYRRFVDSDYEYYAGDDYVSAYGPFTLGSWIDEIQVDGDYSMTIQLTQSYAPFLRNLAMFAASVHSLAAIEEYGTELSSNPVGTGPFQLSNLDDANEIIRLEANSEYWGDGPNVDEVVFVTIGQNSTRAQSLASGELDIIDGLGAQSSVQVENASNANLVRTEGINIGYMAFNMASREEFRDRRVRQAVSHAINTEAIVNEIYSGFATQASQPLPPNVLGHNDDIDPYPYDPEEAQRLLEEAGYGDGFSFELATFQNPRGYNPSPIQTAETVASNLGEIGIEVDINQQSFGPFLEYTAQGRHDACFLGWYTDNADPDNFMYVLLHPQVEEGELTEGQDWVSFDAEGYNTSNRSAWANREYMDLVEQGQSTYDEAERESLYNEANQIAHDEAPWVYLDYADELRGVSSRVSGFQVAAISGPYLNLVSLN
ncbi:MULTISPECIES: ABC transporter substrate-binding protein [Haloferax]|uniref:Putative dipeptides/oligopeptides ABC transporter periplasmic substrate-binding protein n=3 Tax=Haloferax volcanii TaxID=2246 RepID=M0IAQ4_HALVO|nr:MULTISPECIES: ABC transporter substrate-binding protein [Haloferax]ELK55452.1 putative dipeptides/oligopeptides ABC transporter periplasmic substrate-binding protein [Haloferax sp. BAB-2207]ELZ71030.1 putative dipeptides/oligopeptides ABC transporter periplasmic substrate-binding protein [Haloferax lucentense DSM 14919]ELZ92499.1 putative dipeptides/oligopeptides ABC transporter periplasmic substrate-binding protein [Haloferax alexandrinus JCM 10717]MBC9985428.1 ABC transporter substrate-bin